MKKEINHNDHHKTKYKYENKNLVKRTENTIFSLVFVCFRFTEISYFLNFPANENVRKQHLPANAYSCVKMKFLMKMSFCYENKRYFTCVYINFSLTIFQRKDEICYVVLQLKQAIGQLSLKVSRISFFSHSWQ